MEECAYRIVVRGNKDFVVVIEAKTKIALVDALVIPLGWRSKINRPTLAVDCDRPRLDLHGVER